MGSFLQKICDFCSFTTAVSGYICHVIVSRGLKELPDWLYPYKKCKFLTKISKSYFKIMQPPIKVLTIRDHLKSLYLSPIWCPNFQNNPSRTLRYIFPGKNLFRFSPAREPWQERVHVLKQYCHVDDHLNHTISKWQHLSIFGSNQTGMHVVF